ncbi:unnamed protein product [Rotaria socialis]|uniref:AAA+ ATPase domain-containing protein n=1 Tax=Rotaria socialis TaxID=392032 RepID=A0A818NCM9_9BILA|nr:unnamed protein product [Rotaria socialis]CAF4528043.1 unnamed protein product [Rotaria socialis]
MNTEHIDIPVTLSPNYSGACTHGSMTNEELLTLTDQQNCMINGRALFALKYRVIPCAVNEKHHASVEQMFFANYNNDQSSGSPRGKSSGKHKEPGMYHTASVIRFLVNDYKLDPNTFVYTWSYDVFHQKSNMSQIYIDLGNYLSVQFSSEFTSSANVDNPNNLEPDHEDQAFDCFMSVMIFHVPQTAERARILLKQLTNFQIFPLTEATLHMVCHNAQRGFYTSPIRMKKPHITDLKLHYGENFLDIHKELLETLQEKDSTGITLLHGPPGTGKTFYLRYLINEIQGKHVIFVPPDLVNDMTKPDFLPFLMRHPNSVLIIEDAENIVRDRSQASLLPNQAVSNLLNISDGLLGDAMHQQIVCTFNCDFKGIDPALLRDGRLVIEHKFDKLSIENARRLCVELNIPGNGDDIHESISLAEIYARENASVETPSNDLGNGEATPKNKRRFHKTTKKPDTFFGFYS